MMIIWFVLPVVVILLAVAGSSWLKGGTSSDRRESPLEILDRRYAAGEIEESEYVRKKDALTRQDR